jgi:hypothetical protein
MGVSCMSKKESMVGLVEAATSDLEEIPPVLPQYEECWAEIERQPQSRVGDRMKAALRLVCGGLTYRQASDRLQYANHTSVWIRAKRYGVCEARTEELIAGSRRISKAWGDLIEERIVGAPESISMRDLIVARGVENDKLAKYESWGEQQEENDAVSAFQRLADAIAAGSVRLELTVEPSPSPSSYP